MIEIYCDGACSPNPGNGGWAYIIIEDGMITKEFGGSMRNTTNNVMELMALLNACKECEALGALNSFSLINFTIYCDSAYCVNCANKYWYRSWERNGWKTANKKPVANREIWEQLIPFFEAPSITIKKVAGHSGLEYNEIVDQLAVSYRLELEV